VRGAITIPSHCGGSAYSSLRNAQLHVCQLLRQVVRQRCRDRVLEGSHADSRDSKPLSSLSSTSRAARSSLSWTRLAEAHNLLKRKLGRETGQAPQAPRLQSVMRHGTAMHYIQGHDLPGTRDGTGTTSSEVPSRSLSQQKSQFYSVNISTPQKSV
jgi:hypothetical protein